MVRDAWDQFTLLPYIKSQNRAGIRCKKSNIFQNIKKKIKEIRVIQKFC